ncbi:MAG TPA: BamA/TamA family outer membrane protein [Gemmatimonadaceae bacterium]
MRLRSTLLLLLTWSAIAPAQQASPPTVEVRDLRAVPRDIADEVQQVFNATTSRRVTGDLTVPASEVIEGDVAVMTGQVVVAGRVTGRLVLVNGSLVVRGAGRVTGPVTVIGGTVTTIGGGQVEGSARSYPEHVLVESDANRLVVRDESEDERWYRRRMTPREGSRGDLRLVTARTYNRVEGLPLLLGPRAYLNFSWGRLTADAMGVLRSADRFELKSENLGHLLRVELQLGGTRGIRIGGRMEDVVAPVEEWHLSDSEVGLASFLLHRDYRDYYNRHGTSLSVTGFIGNHLDATVSWADERWATPTARDPWSLFRDNQDWRPNPILDAGRFHLIRAGVRYDTRNDATDPWSGWYITGEYEYGVGRITEYGPTSRAIRDINPTGRNAFDRVLVDMRRYNRISAEGQLNLRLVAGGWLSGDDLPLQRRFSLGSAGSLPGYDFRQIRPGTDFLTCAGARVEGTPGGPRSPEGIPAQCERFALGQVEYRGEIGAGLFGLLDQERRRRRFGWGRSAEWVAFADVGRGWLVGPRVSDLQYGAGSFPGLHTFRADVGVGLRLDDLGLYLAKSVTDPRTPLNFFARLQPRF